MTFIGKPSGTFQLLLYAVEQLALLLFWVSLFDARCVTTKKKNTEKRRFYAGTDDSRHTVRNDRKFVGTDVFIVVIDI